MNPLLEFAPAKATVAKTSNSLACTNSQLQRFLLLRIVHFDLLHTIDQLNDCTLFLAHLSKTLVIQFFPTLHKKQYPKQVQAHSHRGILENSDAIIDQDSTKKQSS